MEKASTSAPDREPSSVVFFGVMKNSALLNNEVESALIAVYAEIEEILTLLGVDSTDEPEAVFHVGLDGIED